MQRKSKSGRSRNGLLTTALGLVLVIAGLRSAVAGGGACTATSNIMGPVPLFDCGGGCAAGGHCDHCTHPDFAGTGVIYECGCADKDGNEMYVPLEAPKCGLGMHLVDRYGFQICIRNGCAEPCAEPVCETGRTDPWSCSCEK